MASSLDEWNSHTWPFDPAVPHPFSSELVGRPSRDVRRRGVSRSRGRRPEHLRFVFPACDSASAVAIHGRRAQEVETSRPAPYIHDPGLVRVQPQPERSQNGLGQTTSLFGSFSSGAQDDEVVGEPDQHPQSLPTALPRLVEDVQGNVGEQREIGEPCRFPASLSDTTPPSSTRPEANCAAASTSAGQRPGVGPDP